MIEEKNYTNRFLLFLAASALLVCFIYIFLITFIPIPKGNERYADVCLGFLLGTFMATIIQFFYGSSSNSKDKDFVIKGIVKKLNLDSNNGGGNDSTTPPPTEPEVVPVEIVEEKKDETQK